MREIAQELLDWYDANARVMPWRVAPDARKRGELPDPYRVWMSEVMLQQTTVASVKAYFVDFTNRWPTVIDLANAPDADVMGAWAGLGYYARARNLLKCARAVVQEYGGVFPDTQAELLKLPGIGPYTSAAIASIAFDEQATVMDGNVERVMARLYEIAEPLPSSKPELFAAANALTPPARPGDYAQAVMDLGATVCTPKSPSCGVCPVRHHCRAFAHGTAATLPNKTPKPKKPTRIGVAFVGRRHDGAWLLERRPDKGLLGGMLGWPGSEWAENPEESPPPMPGSWQNVDAEVRHTFTHFHLRLRLMTAHLDDTQPARGTFIPHNNFQPSDLPTVMRKAFDLAQDTLGGEIPTNYTIPR